MKHLITLAVSTFALSLASSAAADNVEIYLTDMLDNTQSGYCVDIAKGKGKSANPDDGLQAHTCYSPLGGILVDQTFDTEKFADSVLYMPEFDVCVQLTAAEAGASLALAACDGSETQSFEFSGEGQIVPAIAPDLCFTAAEATRSGRSNVNQIKVLTLESCSDDKAAYQMWAVRS